MGLIQHHAILATTWDRKAFSRFMKWADDNLSETSRSLITQVESPVNSYQTAMFAPDGSKEGWEESNLGDKQRAEILSRLKEDDYGDGSSPWNIVEVTYGEMGANIASTNCKDLYS